MTDWTAQAKASAEQWMAAQQEWWKTLLEAGAGAGGTGPADWQRQAVETWRSAAHRVADAQADFLLQGLDGGEASQAEQLVRRWTDTQRQLWDGWMAAVGGMQGAPGGAAPAGAGGPGAAGAEGWQEAGRRMVEALQASAEQLIRSQEEWAKAVKRSAPGEEGGT